MKGSGVKQGGRLEATKSLRRAVFSFLGLPNPPPAPREVRVYVYGRTDMHRRSVDNIGDLVAGVAAALAAAELPPPVLIPTVTMHPLEQARLFHSVDVLLTVQGAHMQNSIFMPEDGVVMELSPCKARKTSFLYRFGCFRPLQRHIVQEICFPSSNLGSDKYGQNLTLCPHHVRIATEKTMAEVARLRRERRDMNLS
eukprot:TRINITY_DN27407_c0_g1_i1.p5 TRINITY_DN27407_c0_g1~~TRINITY_DN27407_c0_g1_i1.p5  ORF type:complete len:197 (+),score=52.43 TRINITY_DN27407_c0_g1_i1:1050-1640(+)